MISLLPEVASAAVGVTIQDHGWFTVEMITHHCQIKSQAGLKETDVVERYILQRYFVIESDSIVYLCFILAGNRRTSVQSDFCLVIVDCIMISIVIIDPTVK